MDALVARSQTGIAKLRTPLPLDVPPHIHFGDPTGIDVPLIVHSDAFRRTGLRRSLWNESRDLAVLCTTDADTSVESGIVGPIRLRVGHVDHVVLIDGDVAGPAELLPFGDKLAVRLEDLNTIVSAVADVDASLGVKCDAMRSIEVALPLAVPAPCCDEFSILGKLHDTVIGPNAMPVGYVNISIGCYDDGADGAEEFAAVAWHARLAQDHQH